MYAYSQVHEVKKMLLCLRLIFAIKGLLYHITSHPRCLIGAEAEYKGSYTTFMFSCRVIYYVYVFMFYYTTFMFSCIMTS